MYNRHLPRRRKYQPWLNFNNTLKMLRTNNSFTNRQQLPQKKSMIFFAEMAVFLIAPMGSVFYHALYPCLSKCHYTFDFAEQLHLPNHS